MKILKEQLEESNKKPSHVNVQREEKINMLKEQLEKRNKKLSDTLNHVNMEANVKFKEIRDKL